MSKVLPVTRGSRQPTGRVLTPAGGEGVLLGGKGRTTLQATTRVDLPGWEVLTMKTTTRTTTRTTPGSGYSRTTEESFSPSLETKLEEGDYKYVYLPNSFYLIVSLHE